MRTSTKAALLLTLVVAVAPGAAYAATPANDSREFRTDRDSPIAGAIKHIKRVIIRILEQPAVPIPSTTH